MAKLGVAELGHPRGTRSAATDCPQIENTHSVSKWSGRDLHQSVAGDKERRESPRALGQRRPQGRPLAPGRSRRRSEREPARRFCRWRSTTSALPRAASSGVLPREPARHDRVAGHSGTLHKVLLNPPRHHGLLRNAGLKSSEKDGRTGPGAGVAGGAWRRRGRHPVISHFPVRPGLHSEKHPAVRSGIARSALGVPQQVARASRTRRLLRPRPAR